MPGWLLLVGRPHMRSRSGLVTFTTGCGVLVNPSVASSLKGRPQTHRPSGQHYWKLTTDVVSLRQHNTSNSQRIIIYSSAIMVTRCQRARAVKGMHSKCIGLRPREFESHRCRVFFSFSSLSFSSPPFPLLTSPRPFFLFFLNYISLTFSVRYCINYN